MPIWRTEERKAGEMGHSNFLQPNALDVWDFILYYLFKHLKITVQSLIGLYEIMNKRADPICDPRDMVNKPRHET